MKLADFGLAIEVQGDTQAWYGKSNLDPLLYIYRTLSNSRYRSIMRVNCNDWGTQISLLQFSNGLFIF